MVVISNKNLSLEDFQKIVYGLEKIELDKKSVEDVEKTHEFLLDFANGKVIYGINTGFGPMAQHSISESEQEALQYNLIRSHASGSGNPLSLTVVRATMVARLISLIKGYSGIHKDALILLKDMINNEIYPFIPEHGGVGASGDLVQLAHLALVMIGEGEVFYKGKKIKTSKAFKEIKINPLKVRKREGLAVINGTSCMTGIAGLNVILAKRLLQNTIKCSAIIYEIFQSYDDYFSESLNSVKLHKGQKEIAKRIRGILKDSRLIKKRSKHLYNNNFKEDIIDEKVQDIYSIRCIPQILGPIIDEIENCEMVVVNELNSVSDNPIIDRKNKNIFHGGNFHGDYIAQEMDKLKISITKLSMLLERQLAFLFSNNLNKILPDFVNLGKLGLNLGMQGVQFTATSTVAENQTLSFPMNLHSISTNKDNQDIVSMGTNSSLIAKKIIENSFEVLAIEFMAVTQAIDYLKSQSKMSSRTNKTYKEIRRIVPSFKEDSPKYKEIKKIKDFLINDNF